MRLQNEYTQQHEASFELKLQAKILTVNDFWFMFVCVWEWARVSVLKWVCVNRIWVGILADWRGELDTKANIYNSIKIKATMTLKQQIFASMEHCDYAYRLADFAKTPIKITNNLQVFLPIYSISHFIIFLFFKLFSFVFHKHHLKILHFTIVKFLHSQSSFNWFEWLNQIQCDFHFELIECLYRQTQQ